MKKFKNVTRFITLALVITFVFPLFACTDNGGNTETTKGNGTGQDTTSSGNALITAEYEADNPELDALDYGGKTVNFLTREYAADDKTAWAMSEISVEELNGNVVNDAIYNRNLNVSERLNVEINEIHVGNVSDTVVRDVAAGDGQYDIICGSVYNDSPLIYKGCVYNLYDNEIDTYLDTTKPWWSEDWIKEAQTGDRLYCITGSLALSLKRLLFVTYFNKKLAADNNIEDLYQVVRDGRWTMDYMSTLAVSMYVNLDGDDLADKDDQYGLLVNHYECADIYWSCFDMEFLSKDSDNWFTLSTNQEKIANAFSLVYALTYENLGVYDVGDTVGFYTACDMFTNGQSLMASMHLSYVETQPFRNMTDDYGILPEPKYDEAQTEYYSYAHDQYTIFMIPISAKDPQMCGAVLEAMGSESYRSVDPKYYDIALKGLYTTDWQSKETIDIIVNGFTVDAAWIYGNTLGLPTASVFRSLIYDKSNTFASSYKRIESIIPVALREMKTHIENLEY